jgi:hypothetical protein
VNQHCYLEILARLREAVRRRRPELWPDAWLLHHDNALAHDALAVREFLAKKSIIKLDHLCKHRLTEGIGAQGDYFERDRRH